MGADRLRLLRKILTRLRGTNFCTSSARFTPSKATKQSQMQPNRPKRAKKQEFGVQLGGLDAFVAYNSNATW